MEMLTAIGGFLYDLAMFIIALMSVVNYFTIKTLEKNTNSIKDALVKTTGEAEHAKGMLQGAADAEAKQST